MARLDFSDLTCVIPTHNRVPFLRRQLAYLADLDSIPQVIIVDSSRPEQASANRQVVSEFARVNATYYHDPAPLFEKLPRGIAQAKTPFVVICADDDTFAPEGLAKCLQVIRQDSNSAAVMGRCYILNASTEKLSIVRGYALEQTPPVQRMRFYLNNWFSNFYAIHHRDRLIEQFRLGQSAVAQSRSRLLHEVLNSLLVVCAGPVRFIDVDYLMYQIHNENVSTNTVSISNPEECDHLVGIVCDTLASYLMRRQGLRPDQATQPPYTFVNAASDGAIATDDRVTQTLLAGDPQSLAGKTRQQIDGLMKAFMATQRIPGRRRSRFRRLARETQKFSRRILGIRQGEGFLEKQDLDYTEASLRDHDLRRGFRLSVQHPYGMQFDAAAGQPIGSAPG